MLIRKTVFVFTAMCLASALAVASEFQIQGQEPGLNTSRQIAFEELRARCERPEQFDVQKAPQNIKIQCTDIRREWVPAVPGEVPLPGMRRVVLSMFSDKFHVGASAQDVPVYSKSGTCQRFKEIEKVLTLERPLSCAEIVGMKSSIGEFCISVLDTAKAANPKLVEVREMEGRLIDTCGGTGGGGKH
ncbi:MAG TPA: hypothetical protein DCS07_11490 [Bdellovibrionales bacterium]|nr:MAG: hypothetical protein A2X97_05445 [Bdellovibrionales bacterium GWA1_52_35]OFZ40272.1 MAG: hypothetical protein A2070_06960 [Bdellovibrionales bacterium GWC1_52_8]HAR43232.1 hypothetical protein [Bdellovibrionales bacterium]HCM40973.1 hypothetical protein [Bdellovibrionales bacterium]